jgi:hypothetical protein
MQAVTGQAPSARQIALMLMTDDILPDVEQTFLSRLLAQLPDLADGVAATKGLSKLLRKTSKKILEKVLEEAEGTALLEFVAPSGRPQRRAGCSRSPVYHQSRGGPDKPAQDGGADDVLPRRFQAGAPLFGRHSQSIPERRLSMSWRLYSWSRAQPARDRGWYNRDK